MNSLKLAIVVPCFNEADVLSISAPKLVDLLRKMVKSGAIDADSFILFVNDGSTDNSWQSLQVLHDSFPECHALDLSRNVGHQNAILAGMESAVCAPDFADAVITIDADLQDPIECIPKMVAQCSDGFDVVYGVRSSRKSDSFVKRFSAESFYKLQSKLGLDTIYNHADFRLLSRRVVLELLKYPERNIYLRGIIPLIGFPATSVDEVRGSRIAGKSKYTVKKMLALAFDGITSFSIRPMYMILGLGGVFVLVAIAIGIYVLASLLSGNVVHGWASLMLSIWFVGGVILLSVGLVGLYVGKVYIETKHRPRYHIQNYLR